MATGNPFGWQVENSSGTPVSGAKVYFKKSGTSTNQAAYTDKALTVPAANPVEADAAGWFNVYLDPGLDYDITIKSADDSVTYYTSTKFGLSDTSQPVDATLTALAGLTIADGKIIRGTGADAFEVIDQEDIEVIATGDSTSRTLADWFSDLLYGQIGKVNNYAAMTAYAAVDGQIIYVAGKTSAGDGGEGLFRFDAAATDTADGGTILAKDGGGAGRWVRLGPLDLVADAFTGADDDAILAAAFASLPATGTNVGGTIQLDGRTYSLTEALVRPDYTSLFGLGQTRTRLDGAGFGDTSAMLQNTGQEYFPNDHDFMIQNHKGLAFDYSAASHGRLGNIYMLGSGSDAGADGVGINSASYMLGLTNVWGRTVKSVRNFAGFLTSTWSRNVHGQTNTDTSHIIENAVYSGGACNGSDDSAEHGYEFRNVIGYTEIGSGVERSAKEPILAETSTAIATASALAAVRDVDGLTFIGPFFNDCGDGSTYATAFKVSAADGRNARMMIINGVDDNAQGGYSGIVDGATASVWLLGGTYPGGFSALNSGVVHHTDYNNTGLYHKINGVEKLLVKPASTDISGTQVGSAVLNVKGQTDSAGEVGIRLRPADTNANARDVSFLAGRHARGDACITRGTSQGANPSSAGDTLLQFAPTTGNVGIGVTGAAEKLTVAGNVAPSTDNTRNLGTASLRWAEVFAGNATINTSDATQKTRVRAQTDAEDRAIARIMDGAGLYQWLDSVDRKGTQGARWHSGVTAQAVAAAFEAEGLDPHRYGLFCEDPVFDTVRTFEKVEAVDADGNPIYHQVEVTDQDNKTLYDEYEEEIEIVERHGKDVTTRKVKRLVREPMVRDGYPVIIEHETVKQVPRLNPDGSPATLLGLRYGELQMMVLSAMWRRSQ